jgi:hypothetical protein
MTTYQIVFQREDLIVAIENTKVRYTAQDVVLVNADDWIRTSRSAALMEAIRERADEIGRPT